MSVSSSASSTPDLQRHVVRQLREPAEVRDDEWLAEGERTDRGAGGLSHRRRAEVDVDVRGGHQRPEARLVDVPRHLDTRPGKAETLQVPVDGEVRRLGADEQKPGLRHGSAQTRERLEQLRHPLALVEVAECRDQRLPHDVGGRNRGDRPGRVRDDEDRPLVAGGTYALGDVPRVHHHPTCVIEHRRRERQIDGPVLPERRNPLLHHRVSEKARSEATVTLEGIEIALGVTTGERDPGDEVMQDEVVEDDRAGRSSQCLDDPPVDLGVVADVVDGEIGPARRAFAATLHDRDVRTALELGQEERAVVRDPRSLGRHRRKQRELHDRSLSIARSQVTSSANALPRRPIAAASSG